MKLVSTLQYSELMNSCAVYSYTLTSSMTISVFGVLLSISSWIHPARLRLRLELARGATQTRVDPLGLLGVVNIDDG